MARAGQATKHTATKHMTMQRTATMFACER